MNKKYAIEIISMIDRHMLYKTDHLAKEAACYLMTLSYKKKYKTIEDDQLYDKCYQIKYNSKI